MDLRAALRQADFADVTFQFPNAKSQHAHRAVLCARSDYFRSMFASGMKVTSAFCRNVYCMLVLGTLHTHRDYYMHVLFNPVFELSNLFTKLVFRAIMYFLFVLKIQRSHHAQLHNCEIISFLEFFNEQATLS